MDWIEIFKGGAQRDSKGRRHDGDAVIDKAIKSFNAAEYEPPVVVGHPKDNSPAYGWVEGLRKQERDGVSVLEAKFKQVEPQFADLVNQGRFKNRSASFYADGRLRHVGFLGGTPPAVKGLAPATFSEAESVSFEFDEERIVMYSEEELKAKVAEAVAAEKARADKAVADFAEATAKQKRAETEAFVDGLIKDGKALPAWKKGGLVEFMVSLDDEGMEFSEGGKSRGEWFKNFLEGIGSHPLFKDMVPPKEEEKTETESDFSEARSLIGQV